METMDVYTIDDGVEKVIIHDVRPLPIFIALRAQHFNAFSFFTLGICTYPPSAIGVGMRYERSSNMTSSHTS